MRAPKADPSDGRVRLMQQTRAGTGYKYFFMSRGTMLTIAITPRQNDGDPSDWRVDVKAGRDEDAVLVTEWGDTRGKALATAGDTWLTTTADLSELPQFDWGIVTEALVSVRAVEASDAAPGIKSDPSSTR